MWWVWQAASDTSIINKMQRCTICHGAIQWLRQFLHWRLMGHLLASSHYHKHANTCISTHLYLLHESFHINYLFTNQSWWHISYPIPSLFICYSVGFRSDWMGWKPTMVSTYPPLQSLWNVPRSIKMLVLSMVCNKRTNVPKPSCSRKRKKDVNKSVLCIVLRIYSKNPWKSNISK